MNFLLPSGLRLKPGPFWWVAIAYLLVLMAMLRTEVRHSGAEWEAFAIPAYLFLTCFGFLLFIWWLLGYALPKGFLSPVGMSSWRKLKEAGGKISTRYSFWHPIQLVYRIIFKELAVALVKYAEEKDERRFFNVVSLALAPWSRLGGRALSCCAVELMHRSTNARHMLHVTYKYEKYSYFFDDAWIGDDAIGVDKHWGPVQINVERVLARALYGELYRKMTKTHAAAIKAALSRLLPRPEVFGLPASTLPYFRFDDQREYAVPLSLRELPRVDFGYKEERKDEDDLHVSAYVFGFVRMTRHGSLEIFDYLDDEKDDASRPRVPQLVLLVTPFGATVPREGMPRRYVTLQSFVDSKHFDERNPAMSQAGEQIRALQTPHYPIEVRMMRMQLHPNANFLVTIDLTKHLGIGEELADLIQHVKTLMPDTKTWQYQLTN